MALARGERVPLLNRRKGETQEFKVDGHTVLLHADEYESDGLGEISVHLPQATNFDQEVMKCLALAVSIGLQCGVPLEQYVDEFTNQRFPPSGVVTGHDRLTTATSIVDCIFRDLGIRYLAREDLAQRPSNKGEQQRLLP